MPFVRGYSRSYSGPRQNTSLLRRSMVIPYVRGLSEGIKRILSSADVRVVFRPHSSLRQEPVHPKDPVPTLQKANVVHRIPCTSCSSVCVGQTSRTLGSSKRAQGGSQTCKDQFICSGRPRLDRTSPDGFLRNICSCS